MARNDAYSRMSRAGKLRHAAGNKPYAMWRCFRCLIQLAEEDRAGHLSRCWPEVLTQCFMRLG
jgi:hypothetical protein